MILGNAIAEAVGCELIILITVVRRGVMCNQVMFAPPATHHTACSLPSQRSSGVMPGAVLALAHLAEAWRCGTSARGELLHFSYIGLGVRNS